MSVSVDRIPRAPTLSGDNDKDILALLDWARGMSRATNQLRERTGGSTDTIAATANTANTAATTAAASQAGATIPTEGGAITLTPSNPLSYVIASQFTATISVDGHTRTGAGAPLVAANVSPDVGRGATYYVYYSDAGDAGGAQTFLASISLSTVTGTAGYRIIGTIDIPEADYGDRVL